ncbi:MAG: CDP-diacylglycerol--serine O-phosphatidyltransferase, partial [Gammaproteobacteria bacterium]|nr:CDP-diacylglycerol--serine O-phosphatidyltransferase [Gammaproteobacteria bacterium]
MEKPDKPQLRAVDETEKAAVAAAGERSNARRRGVYLLPNIITTGALFSGFYATIAGMNGRFGAAVLAIAAAIALDTADGRIARLTRTQSQFGAQYDSLSDLVAFGVAPAFVAFSWGLSSLGQVGWVLTFLYVACTALRLARFNTQSDLSSFTGLPSPAAAAVIACTIWVWEEQITGTPGLFAASAVGLVMAVIAMLMVSNLAFFSAKQDSIKCREPFVALVQVLLS